MNGKQVRNEIHLKKSFMFNAQQIGFIIDKVVPLVAEEKDHEFFRGFLFCKADSCNNSAEFSIFIEKLLKEHFIKHI